MKKLFFCLALLGFIGAGHSQILLKEAKVNYKPESMKIDPFSKGLVIEVPEKVAGEFERDPLDFMKRQFDIEKLITDNKKSNYDGYFVNFKSSKGFLAAELNASGELVSSFQKFKNVRLPETARLQILEKYRDAVILSNKYAAFSKGWEINKAHYKVKIQDGDKTRRLRIDKDRKHYTLTSL